MNAFLLLAIVIAVVTATVDLDAFVLDDDLIARINADSSIPWTAGRNSYWEGKTRRQARSQLGAILKFHPNMSKLPVAPEPKVFTAPASFDSRQQWPSCDTANPIRNQGQCGSCWTFGAAEEFSWRRCIGGLTPVQMSTQYIVSCDTGGYGCSGGYVSVEQWLASSGTASLSCLPYTSGGGTSGSCPSTCADSSSITLYKQKSGSAQQFSSASAIQQEISTNGPVQCGFEVYSDFFNYKSGVYMKSPGATLDGILIFLILGGHSVLMVGYGTSNGQAYWICANSWASSWGMNGFFWIGQNQCQIMSTVWAGCPEGGSKCSR